MRLPRACSAARDGDQVERTHVVGVFLAFTAEDDGGSGGGELVEVVERCGGVSCAPDPAAAFRIEGQPRKVSFALIAELFSQPLAGRGGVDVFGDDGPHAEVSEVPKNESSEASV